MTPAPPREVVVARLRPHGRALFWPTVLLILVVAGVAFGAGVLPEPWQLGVLFAVAGLLILIGWLAPLLRWAARHYTVTTRRVVVRTGILVRARQEILHSRAQQVTVRKRGLQALFGSGDVLVQAGTDSPVVLADVPSANLVQAALGELMERAGPDTEQSPESGRVRL